MIFLFPVICLMLSAILAFFQPDVLIYVLGGFWAELVDGCLGMAYGVILTTVLMACGVPIVKASSSIHFSEVFTTFSSALSHWRLKNINWILFKKLALYGVGGGIIGAYFLTNIDGNIIKPFVSVYLIILGVKILLRARQSFKIKKVKHISALGFLGGFCDAIGGGGWGPIVNGTLLSNGYTPKRAIGTVNTVEFFVTLAQSLTFFAFIQEINLKMVLGLILGGMMAAPLGGYLCKVINTKIMLYFVGTLIIIINVYGLCK